MTLEDEMVIGMKALEKFFGVTYRTIQRWKHDAGFNKILVQHPSNGKPCIFKQDAIIWLSSYRKYQKR